MNQEKIGKFIGESRKAKNLTQEQLAEKLGISKNAISKWERGLNLPDASLMLPLCEILNITLNELFAGEKVEEKELKKQSEKNILNLLQFMKKNNRHSRLLLFIDFLLLFSLLVLVGNFILIKYGYKMDPSLKYSQVYISGNGNIKGDVNINAFGKIHIDFDIGANKYGMAVFKNPKSAFKRLKKEYKEGIDLIQKEFSLLPLTNFTYKNYSTYGWQVTTGSEEAKKQARFVSSFLDIYENSFCN